VTLPPPKLFFLPQTTWQYLGGFKSRRQAQRFLFAHDQINLIFRPRRYQLTATSYRHARSDAFALWVDYTTEMAA
jgi:putative transposase